MIHFKSCPRCHGDLMVVDDMYGRYVQCLQCGYMNDIPHKRVPEGIQRAQESLDYHKAGQEVVG